MTFERLRTIFLPLVLVAGCSDSDDADSVEPPPIPASDVDFIDNLVPHHEQAREMSDLVIARGSDPEVRAMAERMRGDQMAEIAELTAIRAEIGPDFQLRVMTDPHAEADMNSLASASGSAADVLFLQNMIPHHAGAVSLAHRAMDNLTVPALEEIARMTIVKQTREMNEMLDMLGE